MNEGGRAGNAGDVELKQIRNEEYHCDTIGSRARFIAFLFCSTDDDDDDDDDEAVW